VRLYALLPGVAGWEVAYDDPNMWRFRFHGRTPEALVQGRESIYFAHFWDDLASDTNHSVAKTVREWCVTAYARPGRMRAGWAYFASWQETAKEFTEMAQAKLVYCPVNTFT
jgi:hypothetical protein